jgi:hypothetical protein
MTFTSDLSQTKSQALGACDFDKRNFYHGKNIVSDPQMKHPITFNQFIAMNKLADYLCDS